MQQDRIYYVWGMMRKIIVAIRIIYVLVFLVAGISALPQMVNATMFTNYIITVIALLFILSFGVLPFMYHISQIINFFKVKKYRITKYLTISGLIVHSIQAIYCVPVFSARIVTNGPSFWLHFVTVIMLVFMVLLVVVDWRNYISERKTQSIWFAHLNPHVLWIDYVWGMEITIGVLFIVYLILNVYVSKKINNAFYLKEERKRLHKVLIWLIPFIGPYAIKSFWSSKQNEGLKVITKKDRKIKVSYHGSGSSSVVPTADGGD